jgi:hypothetical protein
VGLIIGGMLSATVLWLLSGLTGPVPPWLRPWPVLGFAAVAVLRDLHLVKFWLPQNHRQVPQEVLRRGMRVGSLQFGFEMGTGVRTYVSATAPYVVAAGLLLTQQNLFAALMVGAGFGAGRAATALLRVASTLSVEDWNAHLRPRLRWLVPGTTFAVFAALVFWLT